MAKKVDCSDLAKYITQMAMNIGSREGIDTLDKVVVEFQKIIPEINREFLIDQIVEATTGQAQTVDLIVKQLSTLKREARLDKQLRAKIDALTSYLQNGTPLPVPNAKAEPTDAIKELQGVVKDLRSQIKNSEPARRQRLEKSIAALQEKLDTNDVFPRVRPEKTALTAGLETLEFQREKIRAEIRQRQRDLEPMTWLKQFMDTLNAARAIMTSFDISATLRQGGFIAFAHPIRAAQAFGPSIKALMSEQTAYSINKEILSRENALRYARSGLYIADVDLSTPIEGREEAFATRLLGKLPGVRASARAYTAFLNKLRADSFDAMVATLEDGSNQAEQDVAIANFVNTATGRGSLGALEASATSMNTFFFSPRFVASRFQLLFGAPFFGSPAAAKKRIAIEYARYLLGLGAVLALGQAAGGDLELNPQSSDFGKLKFGNSRIDLLSGVSQTLTFVSRVATGKFKDSKGRIISLTPDGRPFGGRTVLDVIATFLRSKLSPSFGGALDIILGEDILGRPTDIPTVLKKMVTPMAVGDIYTALIEEGVPKATALTLLSLLGAGVQTYDSKQRTR